MKRIIHSGYTSRAPSARAMTFSAIGTILMLTLGLLAIAPSAHALGGGCATTFIGATTTNGGTLQSDASAAASGAVSRQQTANAALIEGVRLGTLVLTYYGTFLNARDYVQNIGPMGPFAATDQFIIAESASIGESTRHYADGVNGFLEGSGNAVITAGDLADAGGAFAGSQSDSSSAFVACAG